MYSQLVINDSVNYNKLFLHAWKINCKEKNNCKGKVRSTNGRIAIISCFLFALNITPNIHLWKHSMYIYVCVYMYFYTHTYIYTHMSSWPLNNAGVRGTDPLHSQKSMYIFDSPKNVTINSLPLMEALLITQTVD